MFFTKRSERPAGDELDQRTSALDLRDSPGDEPVHRFVEEHPVDLDRLDDPTTAEVADAVIEEDDGDRGRLATSPREMTLKGWIDVAERVKDEARRDNLTLVSAGIAFFALLSLAPALAAIVSIYGLVSDPADVARQLDELSTTMPAEARQILSDQLTAVAGASGASLSFGVVLGIVVAFWGASAAMNQLLIALSLVYEEEETRGPVKLRGQALAMTVGAVVFLVVVIGVIVGIPAWLSGGPLGDAAATAVALARWPLLLVLMLGALALVYQVGPDRDRPRLRWVSAGALIATVLWLLASVGFSVYASNFGSYNETYGAMGAIVVLMLWLLITALCILIGAEINAELEHQTVVDTTVGPPRPLGERGAVVADTVATEPGAVQDGGRTA